LHTIFSDLPSPAEAGYAKAGNWPPLFGIALSPSIQRETDPVSPPGDGSEEQI
jgi:hypothetical protein